MSGLVDMLNHLAAAWVAESGVGGGALSVRKLDLDAQGGAITLWVESGGFRGEALVRVRVEPPQGKRHTLRFEVEQWPEQIPESLGPLRRVLESARIQVELDFGA